MTKQAITSPLASLIILVLGSQFFQTFISLTLTKAGYMETSIGTLHAASYAGLLVSALYSESIIHRIGHIRAFTAFSSIMASTILIQAFAINLQIWVLARFCSGFSLAALYVTIESWLLAESTPLNRGKRLAIYMITLYSAQALSSQLLRVIDQDSIQPYLLASLLCVLATIPISLTYQVAPTLYEQPKLKIKKVFNINPYGFLGCTISGLILSALYSFVPNYAIHNDLSVSWIMTSLICGGFILQWPFGKLSDIYNRKLILICLNYLCVIPAIFIVLANNSINTYSMIFLIGGLTFALYPISISLVCDKVDNSNILQITGVLLFSYGIGSVLGPILSSLLIERFGDALLFIYVASITGIYAVFGTYQFIKNKESNLVEKEHVDFVSLPRQTMVANKLDPRIELTEHEIASSVNNEDNIDETANQ